MNHGASRSACLIDILTIASGLVACTGMDLIWQPLTGDINSGKGGAGGGGDTAVTAALGGRASSGGALGSGGRSSAGGSGGRREAASGGASAPSSAGDVGGRAGSSALAGTGGRGAVSSEEPGRVEYELPPPDQCHDQDWLQGDSYKKTGCVLGDPTSECGGKCRIFSACDQSSNSEGDATFMCPRALLFSPEFEQAVKDDGLDGFHYAVVGHDQDVGGIDGPDNKIPCCQCYQLVYAYPSPNNDRQVLLDPDHPNPPQSAIPVPPPLIVQAFNTAATNTTFDVYLPAGGMGARNGCFPMPNDESASMRTYMYSSYPLDGQPGQGGVKPASLYPECRTKDKNWATAESLSCDACTERTADACNKIESDIPGLTEQARAACVKANTFESMDPGASGPNDTYYHLNWSVYAMRVECPEHLTRVTGCKLAPQEGVKPVKPEVKTAAEAAKDSDFWSKTGSTGNLYETTTMEDCCRPTCSSYTQISQRGYATDPQYRAFYSCDVHGDIYTQ